MCERQHYLTTPDFSPRTKHCQSDWNSEDSLIKSHVNSWFETNGYVWMILHQVVQRSLILNSIRCHWGAVKRCRPCRRKHLRITLSKCERGVSDLCEHAVCLPCHVYWSRLAANCLCLCELGASFHDHSLRHLWDQTGRGRSNIWPARGGDAEVILHLRRLLGVIFILAKRDREWKDACDGEREAERKET